MSQYEQAQGKNTKSAQINIKPTQMDKVSTKLMKNATSRNMNI